MKRRDDGIENREHGEAIEKMKEIVNHTNTCLFTTKLTSIPAQARPMATQQVDDDGTFWFFSDEESNKNFELLQDSRVQLFYSNPGKLST